MSWWNRPKRIFPLLRTSTYGSRLLFVRDVGYCKFFLFPTSTTQVWYPGAKKKSNSSMRRISSNSRVMPVCLYPFGPFTRVASIERNIPLGACACEEWSRAITMIKEIDKRRSGIYPRFSISKFFCLFSLHHCLQNSVQANIFGVSKSRRFKDKTEEY